MSLKTLNSFERNKIIQEFYLNNREKGKAYTVHHFKDYFGLKYELIYRIIRKIENIASGDNNETLDRKAGSERLRVLRRREVGSICKAILNQKISFNAKASQQIWCLPVQLEECFGKERRR